MNNYLLPHEQFYTAETAIIKKLKSPALSKVYTYPIDKSIKWYKPFPEFPNADQDKYFFKYEYIKALRIKMENLQQSLAEEQLREAIENDIEFMRIKKEDRQLQALNNYFKAGLFSFVMTDVKEKYLQNQAKELMKNNSTLLTADNKIADIRRDDLERLHLSTENSRIQKEIDDIGEVRNAIIDFINDYQYEGEENLEQIKDLLEEIEGEKLPAEEIIREEEAFEDISNIQDEELQKVLKEVDEIGKEELREERVRNEKLEQELLQRKIKAEKLKNESDKLKARLEKVDDFKDKIKIQRRQHKLYKSRIEKIITNINSFEKQIGRITTKTTPAALRKQAKLALYNRYINEDEYSNIINDFPDTIRMKEQYRKNIRTNFKDLFKTLQTGNKVNIKNFMEGIREKDMVRGLEEQPFSTPYNRNRLEDLINRIGRYKDRNLTGLGLKSGNENLLEGEDLQKQLEANVDLESLIPNISQGALYEDEPPTSPRDYDSEGGAD